MKIKLRFNHQKSSIKNFKNKILKQDFTYNQITQLDIFLIIKNNELYIEQNNRAYPINSYQKINLHDLTIEIQSDTYCENISLEHNTETSYKQLENTTCNPLQFLYDLDKNARNLNQD